jgi:hypothetical protein
MSHYLPARDLHQRDIVPVGHNICPTWLSTVVFPLSLSVSKYDNHNFFPLPVFHVIQQGKTLDIRSVCPNQRVGIPNQVSPFLASCL